MNTKFNQFLSSPDVSRTHVAFVYADQIWIALKSEATTDDGTVAYRLTNEEGAERRPRFSPDGEWVAFTAEYSGSADIWVAPVVGGIPQRVSFHPAADTMVGWIGRQALGNSTDEILFASSRHSPVGWRSQLFRTPSPAESGESKGPPIQLPIRLAELGDVSPTGWLAFQTNDRSYSTRRGYRGGNATDIYLSDLQDPEEPPINLTGSVANESHPMWASQGKDLYFLSDRDSLQQRLSVFKGIGEMRLSGLRAKSPLPSHSLGPLDGPAVRFPAIGIDDIIFEHDGRLKLWSISQSRYIELAIRVPGDRGQPPSQQVFVAEQIQNYQVSPAGDTVAFEARGQVFTVSLPDGVTRQQTVTQGVANRYPTWSPDGKALAYWTDDNGEYELAVRPVDGAGETRLTDDQNGFRYPPHWSPDGSKIAFLDEKRVLQYVELPTQALIGEPLGMARATRYRVDDRIQWIVHATLEAFRIAWSPCSRWLAYSRKVENRYDAIFLFDTLRRRGPFQITSGNTGDREPVFDPTGRYLFYLTTREFSALSGSYDGGWVFANATRVAVIRLRTDVPPIRTFEQPGADAMMIADVAPWGEQGIEIDLRSLEHRGQVLPKPEAGNYLGLTVDGQRLLYRRFPNVGDSVLTRPIVAYDWWRDEETLLVEDATDFQVAASGSSILWRDGTSFLIGVFSDSDPEIDGQARVPLDGLQLQVDPRQEWKQIFNDTARFLRDYFIDPSLRSLDWPAITSEYRERLETAVTAWDVNQVLARLAGELDVSHTLVALGRRPAGPGRASGSLAAEFDLDSRGRWLVKRLTQAAPWELLPRSPLLDVGVEPGDRVLSIAGRPLNALTPPWLALDGLSGKIAEIDVYRPGYSKRRVRVRALRSDQEQRLRYLEWIAERRRFVEEESDGRIGYVHIPSIGPMGAVELFRQFRAQIDRPGLIFDVRFNQGGSSIDALLRLLDRPDLLRQDVRYGEDWQVPFVQHLGAKALLVNEWTASAGELFAFAFRRLGLGPLIGRRTSGATIGSSGTPRLVDLGRVLAADLAPRSPTGDVIRSGPMRPDPVTGAIGENVGIEPDVPVANEQSLIGPRDEPKRDRALAIALEHVTRALS